jgi:hypothetical protein
VNPALAEEERRRYTDKTMKMIDVEILLIQVLQV